MMDDDNNQTNRNNNSDDDESISSSNDSSSSEDDINELIQQQSNDDANDNDIDDEQNNKHFRTEKEDSFVLRMKIIVGLSIYLSAAVLAIVTYYLSIDKQTDHFEEEYYSFASKTLTFAEHVLNNVHNVIETLAVSTTALGVHKNAQWPFYTPPSYEHRTADAQRVTKLISITYSPLISYKEEDFWNIYTQNNTFWIHEGLYYQNKTINEQYIRMDTDIDIDNDGNENDNSFHDIIVVPMIHGHEELEVDNDTDTDTDITTTTNNMSIMISPVWQTSPCPTNLSIINYDMLSNDIYKDILQYVDTNRTVALSKVFDLKELFGVENTNNNITKTSSTLSSTNTIMPQSVFIQPLYEDFISTSTIVGHFIAVIGWEKYFEHVLPEGVNGIIAVLKNTCGQMYTYELNGPANVTYLGEGDLHNTKYDLLVKNSSRLVVFESTTETSNTDDKQAYCDYYLSIYPSEVFESAYQTSEPFIYTIVVIVIFMFTTLVFVLYDLLVTRRQSKVLATTARTHELVGNLFPEAVRDQILKEQESSDFMTTRKKRLGFKRAELASSKIGLKNFLSEADENNENGGMIDETKPIADLFPSTTIMFADISGFTAWSSVREPSQIFTLLETVYHSFDQIARARRIFKVETVGDCYVAVAGLPDPRNDHAVAMARFARDCVNRMTSLALKLEITLGPGTADLRLRVGLHSGPVTAGVLRGERARFQLFGDTMNTTARMETTGSRNKIHISQETAGLLAEARKGHWFEPREDIVVAKGKGALRTYWLVANPKSKSSGSATSGSSISRENEREGTDNQEMTNDLKEKLEVIALSAKHQRLVDWNAELLLKLLKKVVARRGTKRQNKDMTDLDESILEEFEREYEKGGACVKDIVEVIEMPHFDAVAIKREVDPNTIDLGESVTQQMKDFVSTLASMYQDNPFHCFEHAAHVTMSVSKLLCRIVAPETVVDSADENIDDLEEALHDHTYGITSDPLTQFAVVLSALIHDVDHRGVPNFVLNDEEPSLSAFYNGKSVAEQNSVDLAWRVLMEPRFYELRRCIYGDETELRHFRRLIVNSVIATDIFDKDLSAFRKSRWNKAFHEEQQQDTQKQNIDRKATIVIEHLIQASDVAHTMQHWHIYQKWNARLFEEMFKAYNDGRTKTDPSEGWYKGEIWFFDNYIIPLAKKLKECGVFGVSSDEYLNYALENRKEWEKKGQVIVDTLSKSLKARQELDE